MEVKITKRMQRRFPNRQCYDIAIDGYAVYRYVVDKEHNVTALHNINVYGMYPEVLNAAIDMDEENPINTIERFKKLLLLK